MSYWRFF